jgi:uncharacterized repeat protein (TIGR01451 family)
MAWNKSKLFKNIAFVSAFVLMAGTIGFAWTTALNQNPKTAQAAFNSTTNRYEDTLSDTNTVSNFSYRVVNTSPNAANGYFLLNLEDLTSAQNVSDLVEFTSITQTFPVDFTTGEPSANATTITENIADPTFSTGSTLNIKLLPGSNCVTELNSGCKAGLIPANVPIQISVNLKMKASVTESHVLNGTGKVFFPNGFDVNAIGWKINLNPTISTVPKPKVVINQITPNGTNLNIDFTTTDYTNTPGGIHTHFYFNTEANTVVNKMYSGPSPYALSLTAVPPSATQICAIVANPNHTIIPDTGNCVDLVTRNTGSSDQLTPPAGSVFLAGVSTPLIFTVQNNTNQASDIYTAIGLPQSTWSDARSSVLKPALGCFISARDGTSFTGSCDDLFGNNGFKINNVAAGATVSIKISGVVNLAIPNGSANELSFNIFSSNTNDSTSNTAQSSIRNITYNSKYAKSLNLITEKVDSNRKYGASDAFSQIQSPYNDSIFAVVLENRAQVPFNNIAIQDALDEQAVNYFNGCSFSQAQVPGQVNINVVGANLQGVAHQGDLNYTLSGLNIPASNGLEPSKMVFYVGCDKNNTQIPTSLQFNNNASVVSFDNSSESEYVLPQDLKSKAPINGNSNLKLEKNLISKSTSKITAGTEVTYELKVSNSGTEDSGDVLVNDIIQAPNGVTVTTNAEPVVGDITNPFQSGSVIDRVVDTATSSLGLSSAFPQNSSNLANTARVFKVSKLKAGDNFIFRYKVIFGGTFPTSCSLPTILSDINQSFPVIRNVALLVKTDAGINNGDTVSGTTNNLSVGSVVDFLKFNISLENTSLTVNSNTLFVDSNAQDNIAIVDNTEDICDFTSVIPPINSSVLSTNDISNLTVICLPVVAGTSTTCSFKLSKNVTLPADFKVGVGDVLPMASCERLNFNPEEENSNVSTVLSEIVVCKNVGTPAAGQSTLVYAQIGSGARTLTGEKLNTLSAAGLNIALSPTADKVQIIWTDNNNQLVIGIPEVSISLNQGDDLTNFEPAAIQVSGVNNISVGNLIPCSSYKLKLNIKDLSGNVISSAIKEFKTTGCIDNKTIKAEKTVPVSSTSGGKLKLVDGGDTLDLDIPAGFSSGDKQIQAKKLDQTASQINGLPKLPQSKRLAKGKTFDLKAFDSTSAITTTFQQPITITMNYTDQDVSLLDPSSLSIKSWDGTAWTDLSNCTKDTTLKTVTCSTTHFSIFTLAGQTALDTGDAKWSFTPNTGTTAPIFKDSTPVTATISNFTASRNNLPNSGEYTCKFEFKSVKAGVSTYTQIATGIAYDPATGCSANLTKALRGNSLNLEFKATLTSVSNPNQNYVFTHKYFMLFRGSGIAFGQ